jgi:hypothetical protein
MIAGEKRARSPTLGIILTNFTEGVKNIVYRFCYP